MQITNSCLRPQLTSLSLYPYIRTHTMWLQLIVDLCPKTPQGKGRFTATSARSRVAVGCAAGRLEAKQHAVFMCCADNSINITVLSFTLHGILDKKGEDFLLFKSEAGLTHCRSTWKYMHYTILGCRKPKRKLRYLFLLGTLGNCTMQQSTSTSLSERILMGLLEHLTPHSMPSNTAA